MPEPTPAPACPKHHPRQHRDRRPPWCEECGKGWDGKQNITIEDLHAFQDRREARKEAHKGGSENRRVSESDATAAYRLFAGVSLSPTTSSGVGKLYALPQERERLELDVLRAQLQVEHWGEVQQRGFSLAAEWLRRWFGKDAADDYPRTDGFRVERFDGANWQPVAVHFTKPAVRIEGLD